MSANKKFKILLVQLPAPQFTSRKGWDNVPLAASYLKAFAYKKGLLNEVDIEILGEKDTNLLSDSRLIDLIVSKSPNVVGFSLYLWNSIRSIFIAEEVKKKLPNIKIVVGGPEVTLETRYILDNPVVNIGCFGEGEFTFVEIIENILEGGDNRANIKGIFYREDGRITVTSPREPIKDLDQIPSPFILGFINPEDYHVITLETIRGCPFRCAYCISGLTPMKHFSAARVCEELKIVSRCAPKGIRFADSDFLLHPNFYEICEKLKEINHEKKLHFGVFTYAEHINKKKANLLKECNFVLVDTGLQSIKSATLKNIQRPPLNRTKFIRGLRLLEERKIRYTVDIMIGLPNDTIEDLRKTLKFAKDNKIKGVNPLALVLMPATRLKKEARKYAIKYQSKPPYLAIEAPYISRDEIEKARCLFGKRPRPSFEGSFVSYHRSQYGALKKKEELNTGFNKVIIELDSFCQTTNQLRILGKNLSRMIYQPFTIWFKSRNPEKDILLIESFLSPIVGSNPFLIWNVILETNKALSLEIIERIKRIIATEEKILSDVHRLEEPLKICAVFPWSPDRATQRLSALKDAVAFYWSLNISKMHDWQKEIDNIFCEKYALGVVIDFSPECKMDFIAKVLQFLYKKTKTKAQAKTIFFRNLAIDYLKRFIEQKGKSKSVLAIKPEAEHIEYILSLDKKMNIVSTLAPSNETILDLIECQMRFENLLKGSKGREKVILHASPM